MKLELGKTYITNNGREMKVLDLNFDDDHLVLCKGKNVHGEMTVHRFNIDGTSCLCWDNAGSDDLDIVKEKPKTVKVYVLRHKETGMFECQYYHDTVKDIRDACLFSESEVNSGDWGNDREFILIGEIQCDL